MIHSIFRWITIWQTIVERFGKENSCKSGRSFPWDAAFDIALKKRFLQSKAHFLRTKKLYNKFKAIFLVFKVLWYRDCRDIEGFGKENSWKRRRFPRDAAFHMGQYYFTIFPPNWNGIILKGLQRKTLVNLGADSHKMQLLAWTIQSWPFLWWSNHYPTSYPTKPRSTRTSKFAIA